MNKTENLTPERAIYNLQFATTLTEDKEFNAAVSMGAEAIERCMIAKKPDINKGYGYCQALCPECASALLPYFDYCKECGQKIDWSDTE